MLLSSGAYKNLPFTKNGYLRSMRFLGNNLFPKLDLCEKNEFLKSESWDSVKVKVNMTLLNHKSRAGDCFECEFYVWFVGENWVCGSMKWKWKYGILATA